MSLSLQPGDVVTVNFVGAIGSKRRPVVIVSTDLYHQTRPDVIVGLITSQIPNPLQPSDCLIEDWSEAGLYKLSVFRAFLNTVPVSTITAVGHLSDRDWQAVQVCLRHAISFS